MKFNHAYDFAFEILSDCEQATDVTPAMLREGLLSKINNASDKQLLAMCNCFDTHEEE